MYSVDCGASLSNDGITFVSKKNTRFDSPTILGHSGLDWCHGLKGGSENPENKLGGHISVLVFEDWSPVLRFGRVCNELRCASSWPTGGTSQIFRGRQRMCECRMENCITMVEGTKQVTEPSKSVSTATGDSAKRTRRKPGSWSC